MDAGTPVAHRRRTRSRIQRSNDPVARVEPGPACSKPPEQAIQASGAALEEAKAAGAETYAPDALQQAQDLLAQAEAAKKTQDEKFVLFRSYKDSEALYGQAQAALDSAKQALRNRLATSLAGKVVGTRMVVV